MYTTTHIEFAKIFYFDIYNKFGIKLNFFDFLYGNIKPDFNKKLNSLKHTIEGSIEYVNNTVSRLKNENMTNRKFSLLLGTVCHFIADYNCLYHNEDMYERNMIEHLIYEIKLHFVFMKRKREKSINRYRAINNCFEKHRKYDVEISSNIKEYLLGISGLYKDTKPCYDRDIDFAIMSISDVLIDLIENSYKVEVSKNTKREKLDISNEII